eukprot:TRINITY_DN2436_c0_g2_i3.p1 TRINITY_DN2436_c0_g2~~TRINITY_DN2436_c0_g2_i3.p1  ORF type:complete len:214 (+),score=43.98 TRINITY_DN2436_c0_g2_i3:97-738(+)
MMCMSDNTHVKKRKIPKDYEIPFCCDPVFQFPLPPLTVYLSTPEGCRWFSECLKSRHSEENLSFCLAVHEFRSTTFSSEEELRAKARELSEMYVQSDTESTVTVNLPKSVERTILDRVKSQGPLDKTIFDVAEDHVLQLMYENVYLNFRTTEFFLGWLEEVHHEDDYSLREKWYHDNKHLIKSGQFKATPAPLLQLRGAVKETECEVKANGGL